MGEMERGGVHFQDFEAFEKGGGKVLGVWGTRKAKKEEEGEEVEEKIVEEEEEEEEVDKEKDPLLSPRSQPQQPQQLQQYKTIFPYPGNMVSIAGEEVWCPMGDGFVIISANFLERSMDVQGFVDRNSSFDVLVFHIAVIVIDVEKLRGEGDGGGDWDGWEKRRERGGEEEEEEEEQEEEEEEEEEGGGERGNMEVWASDTSGNIVIYDVERKEISGTVRREWGMCLISHMALVGDEVRGIEGVEEKGIFIAY